VLLLKVQAGREQIQVKKEQLALKMELACAVSSYRISHVESYPTCHRLRDQFQGFPKNIVIPKNKIKNIFLF
jgi:hypothetical protein